MAASLAELAKAVNETVVSLVLRPAEAFETFGALVTGRICDHLASVVEVT